MSAVKAMTDGSFDVLAPGRVRPAAETELRAVYRTRFFNVVVVGVLLGLVLLGCVNLSQNAPAWDWSGRIPIAVVVGGVLVVRALRRAVTVSPYGLEARHTFTSWRVPWSGVRSFAVDTGPFGLTVLLSDGSTRSAWVGSRRNGERDFATVAAGAQRSERDRARAQLSPNRPLLLFLLGGMALVTALAVADAGRVERRPRAGVPRHTLQELRDLDSQIAVGDGFAHVLAPLVVVAGLGALVRVVAPRRPRQGKSDPVGVGRPAATLPPPRLPLGTSGPFDNPPVAIWGVVFCRDDGVFTTHGTLVHAISHRKVAVTEIDMYTYWSVRGIAEFSVQVQPPPMGWGLAAISPGAQWRTTSWDHPLPAWVEVASNRSTLVVHANGAEQWQIVANQQAHTASSYRVVDGHRRTVATIERTPAGWKCQVYADLPMTTQRLLYVAARWAEQRYRSEPRRRRRGHRRARSTDDLEASIHDDE